jgi:hypothetical protein
MTERSWGVDLHKFWVRLGPQDFSSHHLDTKLAKDLPFFGLLAQPRILAGAGLKVELLFKPSR